VLTLSHHPILITGATGQVGSALLKTLANAGEIHAPGRDQLDLADHTSIRAAVRFLRPRWIINPAAYTAVDKAESEPALAQAINADAPRILGEEALKCGATVLHFSTDYVFDGTLDRPYTEQDPTNPTSIYGSTKLLGEQALAATGAPHIILRTSWVYAATGKNFLLTILRLARERAITNQPLKIVADQQGAPTSAAELARITAAILDKPTPGIYHATSSGSTTWHGFAQEIVRQTRIAHPGTAFADPIPISTAEFPTPARRPANSRLDCTKLHGTFNLRLPNWQDSLAKVFTEL
jgi:dTDP-4-dehydrorhamnose reductase